MSIAIMTCVWHTTLQAHRKLILLSLADNASDDGRCWPSQSTIARRSSISERQLRDHLHALAKEGWLTVARLGNGRGRSTEYRLNVVKIKAEAPAVKAEAERTKAEDSVTVKAEDSDTKAEVGALKAEAASRPTVIEPSEEPSVSDPSADFITAAPKRFAEDFYLAAIGHSPNQIVAEELKGIDLAHPPECVEWGFREMAASEHPNWRLGRWIFNQCLKEPHGPREHKKKDGRRHGRQEESRRHRSGFEEIDANSHWKPVAARGRATADASGNPIPDADEQAAEAVDAVLSEERAGELKDLASGQQGPDNLSRAGHRRRPRLLQELPDLRGR